MDGLNQPHSAGAQPETYATLFVTTCLQLFGRIQTVHGNNQPARERAVLIRQPKRNRIASAGYVRVPFGYEFERETENAISLTGARRSGKHQALRAARKNLVRFGVGFVAPALSAAIASSPSSFRY